MSEDTIPASPIVDAPVASPKPTVTSLATSVSDIQESVAIASTVAARAHSRLDELEAKIKEYETTLASLYRRLKAFL